MAYDSCIVEVKFNKKTKDYYIELPDNLLSKLKWKTGDNIKWSTNSDGTFSLTKEITK